MLRKQALVKSMKMPEYIKEELKKKETENTGVISTYSKERVNHIIYSIIIGVVVYLVAFFGGMLKMKMEDINMDITDYLISSIPWGVVILILVIMDILKVAPWKKVCVIKAIIPENMVIRGQEAFVFYYDFIKDKFVVDNLPDTCLVSYKKMSFDRYINILVQIRKNRLKVIDIVK